MKRFVLSMIKKIPAGTVGIAILVAFALALAVFGTWRMAARVAGFAPATEHWSREQAAQFVMGLCLRDCRPRIAATVTRFCQDLQYGGLRLYEEAMVIKVVNIR